MADTTISQLQSLVATGNTIVPVSLGGTTYQTPASSIVDTIGTRTNSIKLPTGTTVQRPAAPEAGELRFNLTNKSLEFFDGTQWVGVNRSFTAATGGNISFSGNYKIHTFLTTNTPATFTVTNVGSVSEGLNTVEYLIIGGGGGGGQCR